MLAAKFNGGDDVRYIGAVGDQKRPTVDHAIVDFARGVITRVALFDELSAQAGFEGSNGSFVQHVFLVTKNRAFGLTAHRIAAGPAFGFRALHRTAALTRQRAGTPAPHTAYRQCNNSARRCPLWVKSGHSGTSEQCLLYPRKRTSELSHGKSALCHKQTFCVAAKSSPSWITSPARSLRRSQRVTRFSSPSPRF